MSGAGRVDREGSGWVCRVLGHGFDFRAEDRVLVWECTRSCGAGGSKPYRTAEDASMYAAAFNRRGNEDLGRRAPLIGLFPLRLWRKWRDRGS